MRHAKFEFRAPCPDPYLLSTSEQRVELFQEDIAGIRRTVNDGLIFLHAQHDFLPLQEPVKVLPIVHFLVQLKTVVELVHFDLFGVVTGQDLRVDPPIRQVTLRICDLVR